MSAHMNTHVETQRSISDWARATFGPTRAQAVADRMKLEHQELIDALDALSKEDDPITSERLRKAAIVECADLYIMLVQVVDILGERDLFKVVDEKMVINRKRRWGRGAHGHGQHLEEGDSSLPEPTADFPDTLPMLPELPGGVVEFVEPGTGLKMRTDRWYIISDSGSFYISTGFTCPENALLWAKAPFVQRQFGGRLELFQPRWNGPGLGYLDDFEAANVVCGAHLLDFWRSQDPESLREMNPGRVL